MPAADTCVGKLPLPAGESHGGLRLDAVCPQQFYKRVTVALLGFGCICALASGITCGCVPTPTGCAAWERYVDTLALV